MKTEAEHEEESFRMIADIRPHEAYAFDPERFWRYVQEKCPNITRDKMLQALKETEEEA